MGSLKEMDRSNQPLTSFDDRVDTGQITPSLDPNFNLARFKRPYLVSANPARELAVLTGRRPPDDDPSANCQLHLWLIYRDVFGYELSPDMLSREIWEMKGGLFIPVKKKEMQRLADIYFFKPWPIPGRSDFDPDDPKRFHIAVGTGLFNEDGIPYITHASRENGTATVELLTNLTKSQDGKRTRYQGLLGVRRLEDKGIHSTWNHFIAPHTGKYLYLSEKS